jgi:choline dehydrogenase-like flavoprotein
MASFDYDVLIIGSGFGGSVAALRAAEKGYRVGVMESGRRWKDEDIPKTQWDLPGFLWFPGADLYGIQRIEYLDDVLVLCGAGVGGGSHVYANTLYVPLRKAPDGIVDQGADRTPGPGHRLRRRAPLVRTDRHHAVLADDRHLDRAVLGRRPAPEPARARCGARGAHPGRRGVRRPAGREDGKRRGRAAL